MQLLFAVILAAACGILFIRYGKVIHEFLYGKSVEIPEMVYSKRDRPAADPPDREAPENIRFARTLLQLELCAVRHHLRVLETLRKHR